MNINALLSHNTDDWKTPKKIYDAFIDNGFVDCFKFQSNYDELKFHYFHKKLFINPPFSKLSFVCDWVISNINDNLIALLIPSRTDTVYFHKLLFYKPLIIFIKGRLHYNESKSAPFPTLLLIFYQNNNSSCSYKYMDQEELISFIRCF